jgi:hypothetical protein
VKEFLVSATALFIFGVIVLTHGYPILLGWANIVSWVSYAYPPHGLYLAWGLILGTALAVVGTIIKVMDYFMEVRR